MVKRTAAMLIVLLGVPAIALADDDDKAREEMQRKLNNEVMASPFNAGDVKKAQAYAEEAKKQNVAPVEQPPNYWVPGWTCANMTLYPYYQYGAYRNCVYYHYYYGRYWR